MILSLKIVDFTAEHVEPAARIAKRNYEEERWHVPALPPVENPPDLTPFAKNGIGVAAFDGDAMLGFLCSVPPFQNAFGSTGARGVFSPMGANGVIGENRAAVYARLYQAAGEKWAWAGAASHAVCLYAHDKEAQEQFFLYGFGLRCVDAIRGVGAWNAPLPDGYCCRELDKAEYISVFPLHDLLNRHQLGSPFFMKRPPDTSESFLRGCEAGKSRIFGAFCGKEPVAYVRLGDGGETFIAAQRGYKHIIGAYCLTEHRAKGVFPALIEAAVAVLRTEGYARVGVDYESINPTAYHFWRKQFTPYTFSVVRRIDEGAARRRD